MADWLTYEDVAAYIDAPADDPRLIAAVDGVAALVEQRHSRHDFDAGVPANWHLGAKMWAGLTYQQRNAPSGFPGFGDAGDGFGMGGVWGGMDASKRMDIMKLLDWRKPVVA